MDNFPLGNVDDGIDLPAVKKYATLWREQVLKQECWNCEIWYYCPMCFADCNDGKRFQIKDDACDVFKKRLKERLQRYLEFLEEKNDQKNNSIKSISDFLDSM